MSSRSAFEQAVVFARKIKERHLTVYSPGHRRLSLGGPSSMVKRDSLHSYSSVIMSVPLGTSPSRRVRDMLELERSAHQHVELAGLYLLWR
jgi:hypothetical protein